MWLKTDNWETKVNYEYIESSNIMIDSINAWSQRKGELREHF